jgi:hypothetical protein
MLRAEVAMSAFAPGARVQASWLGGGWQLATVLEANPVTGLVHARFDDGREAWLSSMNVRAAPQGTAPAAAASAPSAAGAPNAAASSAPSAAVAPTMPAMAEFKPIGAGGAPSPAPAQNFAPASTPSPVAPVAPAAAPAPFAPAAAPAQGFTPANPPAQGATPQTPPQPGTAAPGAPAQAPLPPPSDDFHPIAGEPVGPTDPTRSGS